MEDTMRDKFGRFIKGYKAGYKTEFKKGYSSPQKGPKHWNWKGNKRFDGDGYILIYQPNHPFKAIGNHIYEHRLVAEKILNRYLELTERVHHINDIKNDNRPENLFVFETVGEHKQFHLFLKNNPILKIFLESNLVIN